MTSLPLAAWSAALFLSSVLFSHTVALRLILLIFGTACTLAAIAKDHRSLHAVPPIWLPFLLWGMWTALSMTWSQEPDRSAKEWRNEIGYAASALWLCYVGAQARNAPRIILTMTTAAAVLVSSIALYHFTQGLEHYAAGWHGGPGNLSSTLITLLPCVLMAAWYGKRAGWTRASRAGVALAVLLLVAAYTTLSRTIWFGFSAQLLAMGALLAMRGRASIGLRPKRIATVLVVALLAGTALITLRIQAEREANFGGVAMSEDPRFSLWPQVIKHIKERPLAGYGFGRGILRESLHDKFQDSLLWHAHNLFLDTVLQVGIPGLLLLLFLLGATLRQGWRMSRAPYDAVAGCGIALIAVVVGMVVRNMTDTLLVRQNALLYWAVTGVLLAWGSAPRRTPAIR